MIKITCLQLSVGFACHTGDSQVHRAAVTLSRVSSRQWPKTVGCKQYSYSLHVDWLWVSVLSPSTTKRNFSDEGGEMCQPVGRKTETEGAVCYYVI